MIMKKHVKEILRRKDKKKIEKKNKKRLFSQC